MIKIRIYYIDQMMQLEMLEITLVILPIPGAVVLALLMLPAGMIAGVLQGKKQLKNHGDLRYNDNCNRVTGRENFA